MDWIRNSELVSPGSRLCNLHVFQYGSERIQASFILSRKIPGRISQESQSSNSLYMVTCLKICLCVYVHLKNMMGTLGYVGSVTASLKLTSFGQSVVPCVSYVEALRSHDSLRSLDAPVVTDSFKQTISTGAWK